MIAFCLSYISCFIDEFEQFGSPRAAWHDDLSIDDVVGQELQHLALDRRCEDHGAVAWRQGILRPRHL